MTDREELLREPRSDEQAHDLAAPTFSGTGAAGEVSRRRDESARAGGEGTREQPMVPRAHFRSYYGRPVLKPPVWDWRIPAYLFTGGLTAGSAVLGAGADLTGRPGLRRAGRVGALGGLIASTALLITDLGRPDRFHHMLRVAKPSSPMSVGTWILVAFGPGAGLAGVAELLPGGLAHRLPGRLLRGLARPAGMSSAALAPALASYSSVLLAHTAVPAWHGAYRHLPFVFIGSAAASGGGLGMLAAPVAEAGPARALATLGAVIELGASRRIERCPDLVGEAYTSGRANRLRRWSQYLTLAGAAGALFATRRSRAAAAASGLALLAGSVLQRFGVFAAGLASTEDPKYVVVPQRERLNRRGAQAEVEQG